MKNLKNIFKPLAKFVIRHNLVIFVLFILSGLIFTVYLLNDSLMVSSEPHASDTTTQVNMVNFTTYQEINNSLQNLKTSPQMPETNLPAGRYNPFKD